MANPKKFVRDYSFTQFQSANPSRPSPGQRIDQQLDNVADSIDETIDAVADLRRPDGALVNEIVRNESLHPEVKAGIEAAVDTAEGFADDAQSAAAASSASATVSDARATAAAGHRDAAAASAGVATAKATAAATSANTALDEKVAAQLARAGSETARDLAIGARTDSLAARDAAVIARTGAEAARDTAVSTLSGVNANVTTLQGRATAVEGRATTLEGQTTALAGRATTLEGQTTTLAGRATTLEERATGVEARTTNLESEIDAVEDAADALDGRADLLEGIAANLQPRTTALEGTATALAGRATNVEGRAMSLEGRATTVEGRATAVEGRATVVEGRATSLEGRATSVEGRASALELVVRQTPSGSIVFMDKWGGVVAEFNANGSMWTGGLSVDFAAKNAAINDLQIRSTTTGFALVDANGGVVAEFRFDGKHSVGNFLFDAANRAVNMPGEALTLADVNGSVFAKISPDGQNYMFGHLILAVGDKFVLADESGAVFAEISPNGPSYISGHTILPGGGIIKPDGETIGGSAGARVIASDPLIGTRDGITPDADAYAICAAFAVAPETAIYRLVHETVAILKSSGAWTAYDVIYIGDAENPQAATIDWKAPASFTRNVDPARFVAKRGETGDGAAYISDTGWSPSANGVQFTRDNCSIVLDVTDRFWTKPVTGSPDPARAVDSQLSEAVDVGVGAGLSLAVRAAGNVARISVNDAGAGTVAGVTSSRGVVFVGRIDAATRAHAINNDAATTQAVASTAIPAGTLKLFGGVSGFSKRTITKFAAGKWPTTGERAGIVAAFNHWSRGVGSYTLPTASLPPIISDDHATYGRMTSQQIPDYSAHNNYVFFTGNYGIKGRELGHHGEAEEAYVRVGNSNTGGSRWTYGRYFLPPNPPGWDLENSIDVPDGIVDFHVGRAPDDRAIVLTARGVDRAIYGTAIDNPGASPKDWSVGRPAFQTFGFIGAICYKKNGEMRFISTVPGAAPQLNKLTLVGNTVRCDYISTLTIAPEGTENFAEASVVELPDGRLLATQRTTLGYFGQYCTSDELTWGANFQMPMQTAVSRSQLVVSPYSGRLLFATNDAPTLLRQNIAVYMGEAADNGLSFPYKVIFDPRGNPQPRVSYTSLTPIRDHRGRHLGEWLLGYDRGRGRLDPDRTNELHGLIFHEDDVLKNKALADCDVARFVRTD